MNVLPCRIRGGRALFHQQPVALSSPIDERLDGKLELGVRPEFVNFCDDGIPVRIDKVEDLGRYQVVTAEHEEQVIKMVVGEDEIIPSENPQIRFDPDNTRIYRDDWIVDGGSRE